MLRCVGRHRVDTATRELRVLPGTDNLLDVVDRFAVWGGGFDDDGGQLVAHTIVIVLVQLDDILFAPRVIHGPSVLGEAAFGGGAFGILGLEKDHILRVVAGQGGHDRTAVGQASVFKQVGFDGRGDLVDVVAGLRFFARLQGSLQPGKAEAGQNNYDDNDDEKFDERKSRRTATGDRLLVAGGTSGGTREKTETLKHENIGSAADGG